MHTKDLLGDILQNNGEGVGGIWKNYESARCLTL